MRYNMRSLKESSIEDIKNYISLKYNEYLSEQDTNRLTLWREMLVLNRIFKYRLNKLGGKIEWKKFMQLYCYTN